MKTIIDASQPAKPKMDAIKINWDLAPEGVTHYMPESDEWYSSWFTLNKNCKTMQREFKSGGATYDAAIYDIEQLIKDGLIAKPQSDLIFTQEMCDKGILPSVGMECLVFNDELMNPTYEKGVIDFVGCYMIVYSSKSFTERACSLELAKFKPLTPTITLIDGKAYQFDVKNGIPVSIGLYSKNLHRFILESSQYDIVKCTNIKPLTVGNK